MARLKQYIRRRIETHRYRLFGRPTMPAYGFLAGVSVSVFVNLATEIALGPLQDLSALQVLTSLVAMLSWASAGFLWARFIWNLEEVLRKEDEIVQVRLIIPRARAGSPVLGEEREQLHRLTLDEKENDHARWEHLAERLTPAILCTALGLVASLLLIGREMILLMFKAAQWLTAYWRTMSPQATTPTAIPLTPSP